MNNNQTSKFLSVVTAHVLSFLARKVLVLGEIKFIVIIIVLVTVIRCRKSHHFCFAGLSFVTASKIMAVGGAKPLYKRLTVGGMQELSVVGLDCVCMCVLGDKNSI